MFPHKDQQWIENMQKKVGTEEWAIRNWQRNNVGVRGDRLKNEYFACLFAIDEDSELDKAVEIDLHWTETIDGDEWVYCNTTKKNEKTELLL